METEETTSLPQQLEAQKALLIAVATGGPRIQDKNAEYSERGFKIRSLLEARGIDYTVPFSDLWSWYGKWSSGDLPRYQDRREYINALFRPILEAVHSHQHTLKAVPPPPSPEPSSSPKLKIFISHSSKDVSVATALIDLLRASLNMAVESIRCTSVDGYRLAVGSNTSERLRMEVREAHVFIGIITPNSIHSAYVLFELGARWGAGLFLAPVLAGGAGADVLGGPLGNISALNLKSRGEALQLIENLAEVLSLKPESGASFDRHLATLLDAAAAERAETPGADSKPVSEKHSQPVTDFGIELLKDILHESDPSLRGVVEIVKEMRPGLTHFWPKLQYGGAVGGVKSRPFREAINELIERGWLLSPEENPSTGTRTYEYSSPPGI